MQNRAMVYCQHLAGIGHLVRSSELARALCSDGREVMLVCGGLVPSNYPFPPSVRVEQLEAIQSDSEYTTLFPCNPSSSLYDVKHRRTAHLLTLFHSYQPDVLVTEMFPFGRKQFAFELLPLLEAASHAPSRPLVVSSVRDILVRKKNPEIHESRVLELVNRFYDLVLVHSDESVQPLRATFGRAGAIVPPVIHTGYITAACVDHCAALNAHSPDTEPFSLPLDRPFVLISCGSGRLHAGQQLITAALEAAPILAQSIDHQLIVCAGPLVPEPIFHQYEQLAPNQPNVHLLHDIPSLRELLGEASLSVSLGGYNTVMELLSTGTQALVLAAEPNGDTEQKTRIEALAANGLMRELLPFDLTAHKLASAILNALSFPHAISRVQNDGATVSAHVIAESVRGRHQHSCPEVRGLRSAAADASLHNQATTDAERNPLCA